MQREYVLASGNRGKLREIRDLLAPLGLVVRPQSEWRVPEAPETASTFVENALIKARQATVHAGMPAIADDSGLVVPALCGEPGIFSARYAGAGAGDQANMRKLLEELRGRVGAERRAFFYCAMVLVNSAADPAPLVASGCWYGRILEAPRGDGGFGYDPLFLPDGPRGAGPPLTAAELAPAAKGRVSHRGLALRDLVRQLRERDDRFIT